MESDEVVEKSNLLQKYPDFIDLEILDLGEFEGLRLSIGNDLAFFDVVTTYIDSAEELIELIKSTFADQDANKFGLASHSLKSISTSIGAVRLSQISRHLEKASKTEKITVSLEILNLLSDEYTKVITAIKTSVIGFMPE